jgi:hypothetical protein
MSMANWKKHAGIDYMLIIVHGALILSYKYFTLFIFMYYVAG